MKKFIKDVLTNVISNFILDLLGIVIDGAFKTAKKEETALQATWELFSWFFKKDSLHKHEDWILPVLLIIVLIQLIACIAVAILKFNPKAYKLISKGGVGLIALVGVLIALLLQCLTRIWHIPLFVGIIGTMIALSFSTVNWHPLESIKRKLKNRKMMEADT